jgi:TolB-like protein
VSTSHKRCGDRLSGCLAVLQRERRPNTEYLADGISDSVINSLSRLPKLKVISLNAVMRYRGKQIDAQTVGRDLNVGSVLIGRMTQRGDDLIISTELVEVRDNSVLWGEQFNRKRSDILSVQEEIARKISEGLRLRLRAKRRSNWLNIHGDTGLFALQFGQSVQQNYQRGI